MNRLELYAGKLARTVLRGREGSNALSLPNQALETKARFISQVITGDNAARRAEDIGGQELSYAEVKAIASGNPAVLTLAEADAELQRLTILKKNHADEQFLARRILRDLPNTIEDLSQRLTKLTADLSTTTAHAGDSITIGKHEVHRDDAKDILGARLDALPKHVREPQRIPLGVYRGLKFGIVLDPQWPPEVYLQGEATRQDSLSRDHHGPRAVLNSLERIANGYSSECARVRQNLAIAEAQLRDHQARFGTPFSHDAYLSELTALRDQLKVGLSESTPEPGTELVKTVAELGEQIKALKATNTIEATPERVASHRLSAEEPVTARIRRWKEAFPASAPPIQSDATSSAGTDLPPSSAQDSSIMPQLAFQERIAMERQRKEDGPSPP